ncbi:hypothetical protein pipiens_003814 [Culex pipiens pipiens]|uniref:Lipase domain-containing protein n=1 Tax=Culex pipiens pipiens TaxID=38569 RepID=A0ABD1CUF2_CULPP
MTFSTLPLAVLIVSAVVSTVNCGLQLQFKSTVDSNWPGLMNDLALTVAIDGDHFRTDENYEPAETSVRFWCGNRNHRELRLVQTDSYDIKVKLDTNKPVMFIIHGWMDNYTSHWVHDTVNDALSFLDVNVCAVDWANLAHYEYSATVDHTPVVSDQATKFIKIMIELGMKPNSITLVGHGMGAQICGQIGHNCNGEVGQIYGLDPAGPLFTTPSGGSLAFRLDKSDAKYVQFIITAKGTAGVTVGEGDENFYVNGGSSPQPNCGSITINTGDAEFAKIVLCSHYHAYTLFRLSMNPLLVYPARLCSSWADYNAGRCIFNRMSRTGIYSVKLGGDYYLRTTALAPFILF